MNECVQLLDEFLLFAVCNGVLLFVYLLIAGSFPYNAFLAAFFGSIGFFVFTGQSEYNITRRLTSTTPNN